MSAFDPKRTLPDFNHFQSAGSKHRVFHADEFDHPSLIFIRNQPVASVAHQSSFLAQTSKQSSPKIPYHCAMFFLGLVIGALNGTTFGFFLSAHVRASGSGHTSQS